MSKQTTISGLRSEIDAFARHMFVLQSRSPIIATFGVDDVRSMDVRGHPRLERMKEQEERRLVAQREATAPIRNNLVKTQTKVLKFKGYEIIRNQNGFSVYGMIFKSITDAEEWITDKVVTTRLNESEDNKDGS
jgi:hypothetical protein